jgi:hypothetical protein
VDNGGSLTSGPLKDFTYLEWSIVTEPAEIDGDRDLDAGNVGAHFEDAVGEPDSMEIEGYNSDRDDNLEDPKIPSLLEPTWSGSITPLEGYDYLPFNPVPIKNNSPGLPWPTLLEVQMAIEDLKCLLHPKRDTGRGYKDPNFDLWQCSRLEGMISMMNMYTNPQSRTYNQWGPSSIQTVVGMGRGTHCAQRLCELCRGFVADRKVLPLNPYGDWNELLLVNENLVNEISIYLLSLGNEITAAKLNDYLRRPDVKEKYGIEHDITEMTACRYLNALGYRYQSTPKGQYVDGHEREDVVTYQNRVFLPKWKDIVI